MVGCMPECVFRSLVGCVIEWELFCVLVCLVYLLVFEIVSMVCVVVLVRRVWLHLCFVRQ